MKLLFFGNCQAETVATALRFWNSDDEITYAGNSNRVADFDPDRTHKLMEASDIVIAQAIQNKNNPDHFEKLRDRLGDKVLFMPYIFIDGLYSMSESRNEKTFLGGVVGDAALRDIFEKLPYHEVIEKFERGEIDFKHAERFNSSLDRLDRTETHCDFKVGALLRENCLTKRTMLTHNHPYPSVICDLSRQIAKQLTLKWQNIARRDPLKLSQITLPVAGRVLSPYTIQDLGASYAYDMHWRHQGVGLIKKAYFAWKSGTKAA